MDTENYEASLPISAVIEDLTGVELNDRIVAQMNLECQKCKKFLKPPIMLEPNIGDVCEPCVSQGIIGTAVHNTTLEKYLKNLVIPCSNASRGCKKKMDYFQISEHETVCDKRSCNCPLKLFTSCDWEGDSLNLLDHFKDNHPNSVLEENSNCFKINVDVSLNNDSVKLLCSDSIKLILYIKCDLNVSKLQFMMYYIGNSNTSNLSYKVKRIGCSQNNSFSLSFDMTSSVLHDTVFRMPFDESRALNIDLNLVKQIIPSKVVYVQIKLIKATSLNVLDEKLLSSLECPVCNQFMKPPIMQCSTGHSLCNSCKTNLTNCPTCRSGFNNTRNFTLETLCQNVGFPCMYHDKGCQQILPADEMNAHEGICPLKIYYCPFVEICHCNWKGAYSEILQHLNTQHPDITKFNNYYEMQIHSQKTNMNFCMIAHGEIFRVCFKRVRNYDYSTENIYWAVQFIGPHGEAKKYKCEIGVIDCNNEHRRRSCTELCQELTSYKDMFKQCITIPSNVSSLFACNGRVTYFCKISKLCIDT